MNERRIVITGLGAVTPGGIGIQDCFARLLSGASAVKTIDLWDSSAFPCRAGGQLDDFSASKFVPKSYRKAVKVMARDIEIAVAAADLAVRDAGIHTKGVSDQPDIESPRLGCNIGAGLICVDLDELGAAVNTAVVDGKFDLKAWGQVGIGNLTPLWLLKYLPNMLSCHVTIIHQAKGPSNTITCGEASGILACGEGMRHVARGSADVVIAGGAETKLNPMGVLRQGLLGRLTTKGNDDPSKACRPFDRDHSGTVVGEGGGLLILEEAERARRRGARAYAEVVGFGAACDPCGVSYLKSSTGNVASAIASALRDAGIGPEQIDMVIPAGSGVPADDVAEAAALRQALGNRLDQVPVVPLAGAWGSLFAGAGGVNLAVAAYALHKQMVPPGVNCENPDPACRLNVPAKPAEAKLNYVLCANYAIGGQSAAMVLKKA